MDPAQQRFADQLDERRAALELAWNDVAARMKMSRESLRLLRIGQTKMRAGTRRALEVALEWPRGMVDHLLAGGEPRTFVPDDVAQPARLDLDTRDGQLEAIRRIVELLPAHRRLYGVDVYYAELGRVTEKARELGFLSEVQGWIGELPDAGEQ